MPRTNAGAELSRRFGISGNFVVPVEELEKTDIPSSGNRNFRGKCEIIVRPIKLKNPARH